MRLLLFIVWWYFSYSSKCIVTVQAYGEPSEFGCHEFVNISHADSIFRFESVPHRRTANNNSFNNRLCSFDPSGVAWTIIQSRGLLNSSSTPENFNRTWNDYKNGFGDLNGEFWYGNDFLHALTYNDDMELEIRLESWDNRELRIGYETFRIDSEENHYNLFVDGFHGPNKSLDAMKYHHGQDFSTFDRINDKSGIDDEQNCCSCAKSYAAGWWFNNCIDANLNGIFRTKPNDNNYIGIIWDRWLGDYSLKSVKMLIRPKIPCGVELGELASDVKLADSSPGARIE